VRFVPSKRLVGARLTWLIVAGVGAVLIVGVVDAVRSSPPKREDTLYVPLGPNPAPATTTAAAPRCQADQLVLGMEPVGSDLALEIVHVRGQPCRTPRLRIEMTLLDRGGRRAEATASIQEFFAPTNHWPNVDVVAGFTILYKCGEREPERFEAKVGPYRDRGRLPHYEALCLDDLGP